MSHFKSQIRLSVLSLFMLLTCLFSVGQASAQTMQDLLDADAVVMDKQNAWADAQAEFTSYNFNSVIAAADQARRAGLAMCAGPNYVECVAGYEQEYDTAIEDAQSTYGTLLANLNQAEADYYNAVYQYNLIYEAIYGN